VYVRSITSGNVLPAKLICKSRLRGLFKLPNLYVAYLGTNLKGDILRKRWFYQIDILF